MVSLLKLAEITETGVKFQSPYDGMLSIFLFYLKKFFFSICIYNFVNHLINIYKKKLGAKFDFQFLISVLSDRL